MKPASSETLFLGSHKPTSNLAFRLLEPLAHYQVQQKFPFSHSTTIPFLGLPTPGSTIATCMVPFGKYGAVVSRTNDPIGILCRSTSWEMSVMRALGHKFRIVPFICAT